VANVLERDDRSSRAAAQAQPIASVEVLLCLHFLFIFYRSFVLCAFGALNLVHSLLRALVLLACRACHVACALLSAAARACLLRLHLCLLCVDICDFPCCIARCWEWRAEMASPTQLGAWAATVTPAATTSASLPLPSSVPTAATSAAPHIKPFWNASAPALSSLLWSDCELASRIDASQVLSSPSSHEWNKLAENSWFSATLHTVNDPELKQQAAANWRSVTLRGEALTNAPPQRAGGKRKRPSEHNEEPPAPAKLLRARKVQLRPNAEQRDVLRRWFGVARWTYNACLQAIKDRICKLNKTDLRAYLLNRASPEVELRPFLWEVPYDIRDEAMNDVLKAHESNFAKQALEPDPAKRAKFEIRFRSRKKCKTETIVIHSKHYDHGMFYARYFGECGARFACCA
jgi:hypothetical protein